MTGDLSVACAAAPDEIKSYPRLAGKPAEAECNFCPSDPHP